MYNMHICAMVINLLIDFRQARIPPEARVEGSFRCCVGVGFKGKPEGRPQRTGRITCILYMIYVYVIYIRLYISIYIGN